MALAWLLLPEWNTNAPRNLPSDLELIQLVPSFLFQKAQLPAFSPREKELGILGRELFFDPRFSADNQISCATCHDPKKSFSDGRKTAMGMAEGNRKTPALINVFFGNWFFWDGRSDSLASQALGPIEHPAEHGVSRSHIARVVLTHYKQRFARLFPEFPQHADPAIIPAQAMPAQAALVPSAKLAMYTLASLNSFSLQDSFLAISGKLNQPVKEILTRVTDLRPPTPAAWAKAWESMKAETRKNVNHIFRMFAEAVAEYERGLLAIDSPFDHFAHRLAQTHSPAKSLCDGFGEEELFGLRLFLGPGGCPNCHFGPAFTNEQFHNIGLPPPDEPSADYLDAGRSVGAALVRSDPFNCQSRWFSERWKGGAACEELPWLDLENLENVGSFKTPTLRNVGLRAPYGHNGSFPDLQSFLRHYNELPGEPFLGHREETLRPLNFSSTELHALEAFLLSLNSPVIDSLTGTEAKNPTIGPKAKGRAEAEKRVP